MDFKNKVAVITGAAGTLCSEITLDLAKKGVKVAMVDLAAEKLQGLAEKIEAFGGEYMIETGTITEEEALNHPQKNIILRALGTSPETDADVSYEKLSPGDILLMCSDGLTNMLTEEDISKIISSDNTPEEKAKELVRRANETGGTDNITVVIAVI